MEAEGRDLSDAVAGLEHRRSHKPRNAGSLWKLEKLRKQVPEPPERMQPCTHLDLSPVIPVLDS